MIHIEWWQTTGLILEYSIKLLAIGIVPEGRRPSSSSAWLLAILLVPVVGLPLFLLMGSKHINARRHRVQREANAMIKDVHADFPDIPPDARVTDELLSIIRLNRTLTSMPAVSGESRGVLADYTESLLRMAEAIDSATSYVHMEIYIVAWDNATDEVFRAMERAVHRGVKVRLLFDQVGSWKYPGYRGLGKRLTSIGVDWHIMLPLQPWRWRFRRPDLRNHRKILVIDGEKAFIGSHNVIDPSYRTRRNVRAGRRWEDLSVEVTGEIVLEAQAVFAMDWYFEAGEQLEAFDLALGTPLETLPEMAGLPGILVGTPAPRPGRPDAVVNAMQLVPSGPGYPTEPNLRMFLALINGAKRRVSITSPYFIPDEALLSAMTSAAYRGVEVELFVGKESDQFIVSHAQRSYYSALLAAGVRIYLYPSPTVLHSKYMTVDDEVGVIGSSNMDFRSFALNYEVMLLAFGGDLDDLLRNNDAAYRAACTELTPELWATEPWYNRYVDNVCRLMSAVL